MGRDATGDADATDDVGGGTDTDDGTEVVAPDVEQTPGAVAYGLVRELRPQQWYKQVIILVPVVFSLNAFDPLAWGRAFVAAGLFSLAAGSAYIVNDVADREADRRHPEKRHRPIASGLVSVPLGLAFAATLVTGSIVAATLLDPWLAVVLVVYLVQNLAYSFRLKSIFLVDIFVIGAGFVLRALAGVVAIGVEMSPWFLLTTFLAALLLAGGKRRAEFERVEDPAETRESLETYSEALVDFILFSVATTLLVAYSLYTFFAATIWMMVTVPFAFYAVFRYVYLAYEGRLTKPRYLLRDRATLLNFLLWGVAIVVALYFSDTLEAVV